MPCADCRDQHRTPRVVGSGGVEVGVVHQRPDDVLVVAMGTLAAVDLTGTSGNADYIVSSQHLLQGLCYESHGLRVQ